MVLELSENFVDDYKVLPDGMTPTQKVMSECICKHLAYELVEKWSFTFQQGQIYVSIAPSYSTILTIQAGVLQNLVRVLKICMTHHQNP